MINITQFSYFIYMQKLAIQVKNTIFNEKVTNSFFHFFVKVCIEMNSELIAHMLIIKNFFTRDII